MLILFEFKCDSFFFLSFIIQQETVHLCSMRCNRGTSQFLTVTSLREQLETHFTSAWTAFFFILFLKIHDICVENHVHVPNHLVEKHVKEKHD